MTLQLMVASKELRDISRYLECNSIAHNVLETTGFLMYHDLLCCCCLTILLFWRDHGACSLVVRMELSDGICDRLFSLANGLHGRKHTSHHMAA